MPKVLCETVASMRDDNGQKAGEEARFYSDGEHVVTVHLRGDEEYGRYEEGKEYNFKELPAGAVAVGPSHRPVAPPEPEPIADEEELEETAP